MNLKSVTGKSWLFKKYNERLAQKIFEKFSLNQAPEVSYLSKFLAIRKVEIDKVNNFFKCINSSFMNRDNWNTKNSQKARSKNVGNIFP